MSCKPAINVLLSVLSVPSVVIQGRATSVHPTRASLKLHNRDPPIPNLVAMILQHDLARLGAEVE